MTALQRLALYHGQPSITFQYDRHWIMYGERRIGVAHGCSPFYDWRTNPETLARAELAYLDRTRPVAIESEREHIATLRRQLAESEAHLAALEAMADLMLDVDPLAPAEEQG